MALSPQWLDELRMRTTLSAVIGRTVSDCAALFDALRDPTLPFRREAQAGRLRLEAGSCHAGSWTLLPVRRRRTRRSARLPPTFEHLDDDHAAATAGAWRTEVVWLVRGVIVGRCDA